MIICPFIYLFICQVLNKTMVFTYAHPPKEAFFSAQLEVNYFEVFCQLNGLEQRCQAPWVWVTKWPGNFETTCWTSWPLPGFWKGLDKIRGELFTFCHWQMNRLYIKVPSYSTCFFSNIFFAEYTPISYIYIRIEYIYIYTFFFQRFPFRTIPISRPTGGYFSGRCDKTSYGSMVAGKNGASLWVVDVSRIQRSFGL